MEVKEILYDIIYNDSRKSYEELYYAYYDKFYRIAYFYLKSEELAQEVTIDVFVDIWEKRKKLIIPEDFNKYSYTLVRNASLNYLQKENKYLNSCSFDKVAVECLDSLTPEENLLEIELFKIYEESLNELPTKCRELFLRVKEDKQSYKEVANDFNISVKTVDAQIQKAVKKIKNKIINYLNTKE